MKFLSKIVRFSIAAILSLVALLCASCSFVQRQETPVGKFYTLEVAYANGWLTKNDLENIAYYFNMQYGSTEYIDETFTPAPKTPETLDEDTIRQIKLSALSFFASVLPDDASFDHVSIARYFGTYHGNVVVRIDSDHLLCDYVFEPTHEIDGVIFYAYASPFISVWHIEQNDGDERELAVAYNNENKTEERI